ncbi:MAG: hypothetical protein HFJ25_00105 [Clostridia bacterium]|nr:hypothetical protein [Clostridia bacterium]
MNLENTKDLQNFFSEENLNFLKNLNQELSKIDILIEKNQKKEEKYSLFLTALSAKDFSTTNKEYFLDVKNIYSLLEKNSEYLKNLKNTLSSLSAKLLSLVLSSEDDTNSKSVKNITTTLNKYIELLDEIPSNFIKNNIEINTFTSYHSTKLLLTTFDMELGDTLDETINLISPSNMSDSLDSAYSSLINTNENTTLIISEKENKVYLPYKRTELKAYMSQYPTEYYSYKNVIEKEFILPLNYFMNNPSVARFRETYSLYRDREALPSILALKKALSITFKQELNPAIIAACKTKKQLDNYLLCLNENKLDDFVDFEILYDMNPKTA